MTAPDPATGLTGLTADLLALPCLDAAAAVLAAELLPEVEEYLGAVL